MRVIAITNAAKDLQAETSPFAPSATLVFANPTAGALIVQEADDAAFTTPVTVATVPADGFIEGTPRKQYIRVSTAATVYVLGN